MLAHVDPVRPRQGRDQSGTLQVAAHGDWVMEDPQHLVIPSIRPEDGEERFKAIGAVQGKVYPAISTWRGDLPRFISVRRSNKR
jgi:uncharacterized DUF497 family protein